MKKDDWLEVSLCYYARERQHRLAPSQSAQPQESSLALTGIEAGTTAQINQAWQAASPQRQWQAVHPVVNVTKSHMPADSATLETHYARVASDKEKKCSSLI